MTDAKPSASAQPILTHEINVLYQNGRLVVEQPEVLIDDQQPITWKFIGIPDHWAPGILFLSNNRPFIGPFERLECHANKVVGRGNTGRIGCFRYIAMIRDWRHPQLSKHFSAPAQVWQGPVVTTIEVEIDLATCQFCFNPLTCVIEPGQVVRWHFTGLDSHSLAEVNFRRFNKRGEKPQPASNFFGPFESFSYFENGLEGSGEGLLRGQHGYDVHVVTWEPNRRGAPLRSFHSTDPIIDNEEDPQWPLPSSLQLSLDSARRLTRYLDL